MIASQDKKGLAVRSENHSVGAVLASAFELSQRDNVVELIITVRVRDSVEPGSMAPDAAPVDDDVETIVGPKHSVGGRDLKGNAFDFWGGFVEADAVDALTTLIGAVEAPLVIDRHRDPRSLIVFRNLIYFVDTEALRVNCCGRVLSLCEWRDERAREANNAK